MVSKLDKVGKTMSLILGFSVILFAVLYHTYSYEQFIALITGADAHIYKKDNWTKDFFNPATYTAGLWFSRVGILVAVLALWAINKLKRNVELAAQNAKSDLEIVSNSVIIIALSLTIWIYYVLKIDAATDEIFSGYFFAEQPLWLTASYYPLPNNHIFFNLLNHLAYKLFGNAITTGKIISFLCYIITLLSVDRFIGQWISDRWLRLLIIALVAVQLPVFGYATQARGYSLYILLGWLAFVHLYNYAKLQESRDLWIYGICCALGMWTIPSWLYIWVGLGSSYVTLMIRQNKWDRQFAFMTLVSASMTYLLYLPVLCFSGLRSLLANKYVASVPSQSVLGFVKSIGDEHYFTGLFNDWLGLGGYVWVGLILLVFIAFVLGRNKDEKSLFVFYLGIIIGLFVVVLLMRKVPFYRNLSWHGLVFWVMIGIVLFRVFSNKVLATIYSVGLLWSVYINETRFPFQLYYYDVAEIHANVSKVKLAPNSRIVIHEEAFYWLPYARSMSTTVEVRNTVDTLADYYITKNDIDVVIDSSIWKKYADGWYSTVYRTR